MEVQRNSPVAVRVATDEDIGVLQVAEVVVRRWRTIAIAVGIALLLGALVYWLQPERYRARVVLVPSATEPTGATQLLASQLPAGLGQLLRGTESNEKLIASILDSRSLTDSLVSRLAGDSEEEQDLIRVIVDKHTDVQQEADGSIIVEVQDADSLLATRVANEFPGAINSNVVRISSETAVRKQEFLESQIAVAANRLEASEEALIAFQQQQDLPEVQEQARRTVEVAAELQQAIIENELTVAQLRRTTTPDHPLLREAEAKLLDLRAQLRRLSSGIGSSGQILVPLQASPELKVASVRLLREYTKNEQIYTALTAALAETQINANNNLPVVSVLDRAIVPQGPARLSAPLLFGTALLLGLVIGFVAAFGREFVAIARRDPESQSFFNAWDQLRGDVRGWLPWRRRTDRIAPS